MRILAYEYCQPGQQLNSAPAAWGQEIEQVYRDFAPQRSQWQQCLAACQNQPVDHLLVQDLADLGDSVSEVSDRVMQLEALGVTLLTLNAEDRWLPADTHPSLHLLQALQSRQRSRRIRQGHSRNRLKTLPPPGKAPYGYRRGKERYALDRRTAPVVKDFFEHFLLYGSLRGAVRYLEAKHAKKIAVSTGRRWLTNPVYRGDLVYQNQQVVLNTHPAIVSREEAAQVDRLLHRNRRLAPRAASAPRSLSGLVRCAICQSPMTVARVTAHRCSQEYLYLRPKACPRSPHCAALPYQQVLNQTIDQICQDLPQAIAALDLPQSGLLKQQLEEQIMRKHQILQQLPELVATQILDSETVELRTYRLQTEIAGLQSQLVQLPPVNLQQTAQAVSIPQFWRDLSEAERRFYFREFIRQIEIERTEQGWSLKLRFIF